MSDSAALPGYSRSTVPAGTSGPWVIEKIELQHRNYDRASDPRPECFHFRPGTYTVLRRNDIQFMTDLYDEWWTQRIAIAEAQRRGGHVLVTGLGLGLVAEAMLESNPDVRVTVVEFSPDVVKLVAPHLRSRHGSRLEIVEGNAFTWQPPAGARYSVGWHDIWPDPYAATNGAEMQRLDDHYAPYCEWQGFWPREYIRAAERRD